MTMAERMGWLRAAVGVAMILVPRTVLGVSGREEITPTAILLLRTIGIRDLALGVGVVAGARSGPEEARRWTRVAMASDSMDVAASLASRRSIGTRDALAATALAVVAVVGDTRALRAG
jgi:hypothetical protein